MYACDDRDATPHSRCARASHLRPLMKWLLQLPTVLACLLAVARAAPSYDALLHATRNGSNAGDVDVNHESLLRVRLPASKAASGDQATAFFFLHVPKTGGTVGCSSTPQCPVQCSNAGQTTAKLTLAGPWSAVVHCGVMANARFTRARARPHACA